MNSIQQLMEGHTAAKGIKRAAKQTIKHAIYTASTTAISEIPIFQATYPCTVLAVSYLASTASTPDSGSNQNLIVTKYDGAGGAGATLCSATISNGTPTAANQSLSLGSLTDASMVAGEVLTFKSALTGTATVPTGTLIIDIEVDV